jgi:hypothetical protein
VDHALDGRFSQGKRYRTRLGIYSNRKNALVVLPGLVPGIGLFVGNVDKLCRIKHFAAGLAFDELDIVLAGDDLYDGMFAGWSHERERRMVRILPVLPLPCQGPICRDFLRKPAIPVSISLG